MATIDVEIASRRYALACRDGEEANLRAAASLVDAKAREAGRAMGPLSEARQLLFASLLLADALQETKSGEAPAAALPLDPALGDALERIAARIESLAATLEDGAQNP